MINVVGSTYRFNQAICIKRYVKYKKLQILEIEFYGGVKFIN